MRGRFAEHYERRNEHAGQSGVRDCTIADEE